jgi:hypothetical protein
MELSPDDLSAEDEPVPSWGESDMVPAIDDSSTELPPAANAEESAMIIEQQVDEVAVEPIAELSFDDLTEDNVAPTEPSGEQPSFFIPEGQPDPVPADQPFPFFTTEEGAKPSDEEIDPNQFNFEKW